MMERSSYSFFSFQTEILKNAEFLKVSFGFLSYLQVCANFRILYLYENVCI